MMQPEKILSLRSGQKCPRHNIPRFGFDEFRQKLTEIIADRGRIAALWANPTADRDTFLITAALILPADGAIALLGSKINRDYPAITPAIPAAHLFEREIAELWDLRPAGHPWLKPVRFQSPRQGQNTKPAPRIGITDFFATDGDQPHEVAVGPVHAGVIEPGHFRFQCHGETVHHLEISLGYQHRGVERAMIGGPNHRTIHYAQTLAGDTTIGHTTAYCRAVEALSGAKVPARAQVLRAVTAELERVANHIGDLGAIAGDVGFLPTLSYCGRIRGDALNATALICGNRFGRGMIIPGGVACDIDARRISDLTSRLTRIEHDARSAIELMFDTPSVQARLEGIGELTTDIAENIGLVGLAARASGLNTDIRHELPYGIYRFTQIPLCRWTTGDCFARAYVRWLEVQQSLTFVRELLKMIPDGPISQQNAQPAPNPDSQSTARSTPPHTPAQLTPDSMTVSLVEGWRGEICHVVTTDSAGRFDDYKIIDPSFHNWFGLALALRQQQISDFPLCNKSFNLSYCGHDL